MRNSCVWWILLFAIAASAQTPTVNENGVLNSASYVTPGQPGNAVAPGALVAIFGSDLAGGLTQAGSIPLSTQLADVTVRFNNTPAPLMFVSPNQVNAQLPWGTLPEGAETGTASVVVTRGANSSQARNVQVARFSPGIYTFTGDGLGRAVAVNSSDGTVAQPQGSIPGVNSRAVRRGETIIVYASGMGPVDPRVTDGAASMDALRRTTTNPTVLIGGMEAQVIFSGLSPQFPGVNQLNVTLGANAPTGDAVPIQIRLGGITTTDRVTIAVQN
jgi:uncharacterized protein (TIGR03437 family)